MEKQFLNTISKYNMINNGDTVIVGLSGGCDSVALFMLFQKYKEYLGISIEAVHLNHLVRSDSYADENFCVELCERFNTPLHRYHVDIEKLAKEQKLSSEEAGRHERYKAFNNHVKDCHYKIAVAHNKNDVAETFLMRLFRGAGTNGLKSIAPVRDNIIRPIIEIERKDLENYLNSLSQPFCTDSTNLLPIYTRNKIRLNLLPMLKSDFNKNIISTLYDTSKILEEEQDFVNAVTVKTFKEISTFDNNKLTINLKDFNNLHTYLQKQVLLKATSYFIENNQNISKKHLHSILEIIKNQRDGERTLNLPNNLLVQKTYNHLIFKKKEIQQSVVEQDLNLDTLLFIKEVNKYIYAKVLTEKEFYDLENNNMDCFDLIPKNIISKDLKVNIVKSPIFCYYSVYDYLHIKVRSRQNGDKINIKNLGTKKLKDYFIDKKIPKECRDLIPLIALGNEVLWVLDDFNTVNNNYLKNTENTLVIILMEAN